MDITKNKLYNFYNTYHMEYHKIYARDIDDLKKQLISDFKDTAEMLAPNEVSDEEIEIYGSYEQALEYAEYGIVEEFKEETKLVVDKELVDLF